jgi:hypothetical protein
VRATLKRWIYAAGVVLVVLVLFAFVWYGVRPAFPFVVTRHGEPRTVVGPGDVELYSFKEPAADVLAAMKSELLGRGWRLEYSDEVAVIFTKSDHGTRRVATLYYYRPAWKGFTGPAEREPASTTCLVLLPKGRNWTSNLPAFLANWLKPNGKPRPFEPELDFGGVDFVCKSISPSQAELIWRNRTNSPAEVQVTDIQIRGFDCLRLPGRTTVPPFSAFRTTLEFPASLNLLPGQSLISNDGSYFGLSAGSIGYKIKTATSVSGMEPYPSYLTPSLVRKAASFEAVFENKEARTYEIKDIEIEVDGVTRLRRAPPIELLPGKAFRIPIPRAHSRFPTIMVRGKARLRPNVRWRPIVTFPP